MERAVATVGEHPQKIEARVLNGIVSRSANHDGPIFSTSHSFTIWLDRRVSGQSEE
ncbi:hypothetical protein ACFQH3_00175 [Haladaptatus sp. GCM10025707]|uniref:hypothetical protein n=1 Tax=unclassified Haladaptatus TaxID=2622732 RepID=UPI0023E8E0E6|nr:MULTISPECIES: hypothetical protein [unclassified Haladaptatus]